jgi:hypothetical protein
MITTLATNQNSLKKNTKVGIVFWVKFRQMTIIFLQIGEILVLFEFFSCQISKEI